MRGAILSILAGSALAFAATAANASVSLGSSGSTSGTTSVNVTQNGAFPNFLEFDTTNASSGTVVSWFNFFVSPDATGAFSATVATNPPSTVTLLELLSGGTQFTQGANLLTSTAGTQLNYGTLTTNTWYTFRYTANMATAGNISGPASLYAAVPEPGTWALMLLGFGGMGMAMRRRRSPALAQIA